MSGDPKLVLNVDRISGTDSSPFFDILRCFFARVEIVSEAFDKKPLVQRHRQVYDLLKEELEPGKIHALALKLKTPLEAEKEASKRTL